ncbi:MAG: HAD family hydrolase [Planctomycetota bacterium]
MLVLFDIDLTLLDARAAGAEALRIAGRELFGEQFSPDGVDYAGRLDPLIVRDVLAAGGVEPSDANARALRESYSGHISRVAAGRSRPLPGARELVAAVGALAGSTRGVLTGNFEESGSAKLKAAGFELQHFRVRVWGDASPHDPPHRDHLPPIAMDLHESIAGRRLDPGDVVVIGDTPHDVRCARVNRCRSLGVATGRTPARGLAEAGADRVIDDLTDTRGIIEWLQQR